MNSNCLRCEKINSIRHLKLHRNTARCPLIYEIVPVVGCEFQCVYCNALGQEEGKDFVPVQVDMNYVEFLKEEIKKQKEQNIFPLYYYSPKTDCFQNALLETGVTKKILEVLNENECKYIIVSKGVPNEEVFDELVKSGNRCQIIITYGMPSEEYREKLEKGAATKAERYEFAKRCKANHLQTCIILEPILPLADLTYVEEIMKRFSGIGINHFALDFARISEACLEKIETILPECKEQFEKIYHDPDADKQTFKTAVGTTVMRNAPSKKYILKNFISLKRLQRNMVQQ